MKIIPKLLSGLILACAALAAAPAMAHHHGRVGFGFYFGGPVWYPAPYYYYPPPVYYYPPPVVYQQAPQYIEQPAQPPAPPAPQSSAPQPSNDWYYCRDSQAYYPYVKQCASPWQRVPSRPGS